MRGIKFCPKCGEIIKFTDSWYDCAKCKMSILPADAVSENVNHPSHYQGNGLEAIDVIEAFNLDFSLGNAIKYILRSGKKGCKIEDLKKSVWYIEREIENLKSLNPKSEE